ncbi:MAG: DNA cytosine methyltransferase [Chromatiales bacterium]|nr:DNA cytosine methyltransferase [Chromatiales bacterium]
MVPTAIDVFSGAGGLTVGLKRAGFRVVAAVEIEPHPFSTYKANHPEVRCLMQDIETVSGAALLDLAGTDRIDLLAGCPPCQGFTSLTAKYRDKEDSRNKLVFEMARLAEELRPKAIMMENVPGLVRKGRPLLDRLCSRLRALDYRLTEGVLQVADYGVPQFRRRFVLLGGRGFEISLPDATHSCKPAGDLAPWRTVRDAIQGMPDPVTLAEAKARGPVERSGWHVVRELSRKNVERIKAARAGETWTHIPEHLRPECHRDGYVGFTNVYGRMEWDRPSPTITGGCTTFSKGRFGHPEADRTISVREAALLQTFPRDYRLDTPYMDQVCNMIGNALPCDFAEALSRRCLEELRDMSH